MVRLVNFGVYWIPNIIGTLNRDTEMPILFGITWYELRTFSILSSSLQQQAGQAETRSTARGSTFKYV